MTVEGTVEMLVALMVEMMVVEKDKLMAEMRVV